MSRPTWVARMTKVPFVLSVAPMTVAPAAFSTGIGSPVSIDSSTAERAFDEDPVDRDLLARANAEQVAGLDGLERARPPRRRRG